MPPIGRNGATHRLESDWWRLEYAKVRAPSGLSANANARTPSVRLPTPPSVRRCRPRPRKAPSHAPVAREILPAVGMLRHSRHWSGKSRNRWRDEVRCQSFQARRSLSARALLCQPLPSRCGASKTYSLISSPVSRKADQERVAQRVWRKLQFKAISLTLMHNPGKRDIGLGERKLIAGDAFHLVPFGSAGDDETEIADLRSAGGGPIDLIDDPVSEWSPRRDWVRAPS